MAIQDNWNIDYVLKTITHRTDGPEPDDVYTVLDFYKWIMSVVDDAEQMDDDVPISAQTPNEYKIGTDSNGLLTGWSIPDSSYQFLTDGSILDTTNNNLWANVYTLGSIADGSQIYIIQNGVELPISWPIGHINILVKITEAGVSIGDKKILLMIRDTGSTYDHVEIDFSTKSVLPASLATTTDLNNITPDLTVAAYPGISATFGTISKDLLNDNGAVSYDVSIECGGHPLLKVYEYLKYITRHDAITDINGQSADTYLSAVLGYTEVKPAPFGTFAGGTFFGARGVWLENYGADDAKSFQLIDSTGTQQEPPNVIPIKVTGLEISDRVLVAQLDGTGGNLTGVKYIDEAASSTVAQTTQVYGGDIPVIVKVRKYGILPFEVESVITSTGLSVSAIRTTDGIVS